MILDLIVPSQQLKKAIYQIYLIDNDFQKIETFSGRLKVKFYKPTFASLVRIIVGQQLSTKAADAIFLRLNDLILGQHSYANEILPSDIVSFNVEALREVGMSRAKINCCQQLAISIIEEKVSINFFSTMNDDEIFNQLIQIKGIGKWTVEIFLLFCLERLDTLPAADLAIQFSYQKLKNLSIRPTAKEITILMEPLKPYRGAAAHLLWHYYRHLTQNLA